MADQKGKLFIVSGPSGVGKTALVEEVLRRFEKEHSISRIITYTSRGPRENEANGKDYMFVSAEDFKQKVKDGFFLESTEYAGHFYGSPFPSDLDLESGKSFILIIDIEGAKRASTAFPDAHLIWVAPPDMETLRNRLKKRGTESEKQIEKRLEQAEQELEEAHKIRLFEYVLVNDNFEQAVNEFIMLLKKFL